MSMSHGDSQRAALDAWVEVHRDLMRAERDLADVAMRVATVTATQEEMNAANVLVIGLRARCELLMQQFLTSRTRL